MPSNMPMQRLFLASLVSVLSLALTACGQSSATSRDAGAGALDLPPIHVELTEEGRRGGAVVDEKNYRQAWANCQHVPNVPKQPLDRDVVDKLGRTYYQLWYAGQRLAVRSEHWTFKPDSMCRFSPVHQSNLALVGPDGAQLIDLTAHTSHFDPNIRLQPKAAVASGDGDGGDDDDAALRAKVQAQLQQQGYGGAMAQSEGADTAAGQPCRDFKDATSESCVWSGGDRWGFGAEAGVGVASWSAYALALRMQPADGGDGQYLTAQRMTVGQPFDRHVFDQPSGLHDE